jgi:hypothetical protein
MGTAEIADYVGDMATELAKLAHSAGLQKLHQLCCDAASEAACVKAGEPGLRAFAVRRGEAKLERLATL